MLGPAKIQIPDIVPTEQMAGPKLKATDVSAPTFGLSNGRILDRSLKQRMRLAIETWEWRHGRSAPWRATTSPWAILVSELLLQRTRYEQVARVMPELLAKYPTPEALAGAPRNEVAQIAAPLGLERRVDALCDCATTVVEQHQGQVPQDLDALLALPGVGNYVARTTRCLAFGQPGGAVDAAIGRMLRRAFGLRTTIDAGYDRELWALSEWLSGDSGAEYFCGLVDVAGELCRPTPRCGQCPMAVECSHAISGEERLAAYY
jgi:A/G-specific adenine glycosylase